MSEDNYWYDRYLSVCDNNNYLTAQLDASRALLAERDKEIEKLTHAGNRMAADCNKLFDENSALRAEVDRLTDAAIKMDDNFNNLSKMYDEVVEKRKTFGAWVTPREAIADARKQAAQEIYNSLQKCFWAVDFETVRANLKHKFGLEG